MNPLNSIINFNEYLIEWTSNVLRQVDEAALSSDDSYSLSQGGDEPSSEQSEDVVQLHKSELK